jgi:hypothetical protein
LGNAAKKCCFGKNEDKSLRFFMKVCLTLALSDTTKFDLSTNENNLQIDYASDSDEENDNDFIVNFGNDEEDVVI